MSTVADRKPAFAILPEAPRGDSSKKSPWYSAWTRSALQPPGWLVQTALRAYLECEYQWDLARGTLSTTAAGDSAKLAEHSRDLMRVHYDMPLPLFERMLGPSMKYSMARWDGGITTLEDAQSAMLADVCAKAGIRDGDSILDLGCGFGSLAAHLLRNYPRVRVTGLTLSRTQAAYIRRQQQQPGNPLHAARFRLIEADFNDAELPQEFDRVLSLGVFEHIANLSGALAKIRRFLRPGGEAFLHYIVYLPVRQGQSVARQNGFIQRHIFPGGRVYAFAELARHQADFRVRRSWYLPGTHYRKTLEQWLENFQRHRQTIARAAGLDEGRLRIWEIYLRACAAMFATAGGWAFGNGQYLLASKT